MSEKIKPSEPGSLVADRFQVAEDHPMGGLNSAWHTTEKFQAKS
jgi:hypothetical protein